MGRRFSWRRQCGSSSRPQIQKLYSPIQRHRKAINFQACRILLGQKKDASTSNYDCLSSAQVDAIAKVVYERVIKAMAETVAKTTVTAVSNSFKDLKGDIPTTGFTYYATVKMDELQMDDALENGKELNESCSSSDVYGSHLDHQDSDVMISENIIDDDDKAGSNPEDSELEAIKARVREMEEEAEKLRQLQTEVDRHMNIGSPPGGSSTSMSIEEKMEVDARSVYVGNVDYGATAEELEQHFHGCGSINRVTILCNKFDGHPKGFAYVEFADRESVNTAMAMDESLFRGRQIKVMPKRTNRPGLSRTDRPPRGSSRGSFSRASFRGRGGSYPFRGHRFPRRYRARGAYFAPY